MVHAQSADTNTLSATHNSSAAIASQSGLGNITNIEQTGAGNTAIVVQHGTGNRSIVRQSGGDGRVTHEQEGNNRDATITQSGAPAGQITIRQDRDP